jgi:inner membrane protein
MASIGHVAVGLALGRVFDQRPRSMALLSLLSILPDADVVGFAFGIPYAAPLGHRGASHSLAVAAVLSLGAAALLQRTSRASYARALTCALIVALSHGLLDTLTDGGKGVALFWPFSTERYFAPVRPIPVAPIGASFVSMRGLNVVLWETVAFLPLLVYAFFPRRRRAA